MFCNCESCFCVFLGMHVNVFCLNWGVKKFSHVECLFLFFGMNIGGVSVDSYLSNIQSRVYVYVILSVSDI